MMEHRTRNSARWDVADKWMRLHGRASPADGTPHLKFRISKSRIERLVELGHATQRRIVSESRLNRFASLHVERLRERNILFDQAFAHVLHRPLVCQVLNLI